MIIYATLKLYSKQLKADETPEDHRESTGANV
jgi:hypothetical protein